MFPTSQNNIQIIVLMVLHRKKWHWLHLFIHCLELSSFSQKKKQICNIKKLCENKDFCSCLMPFEETKILEFNDC